MGPVDLLMKRVLMTMRPMSTTAARSPTEDHFFKRRVGAPGAAPSAIGRLLGVKRTRSNRVWTFSGGAGVSNSVRASGL